MTLHATRAVKEDGWRWKLGLLLLGTLLKGMLWCLVVPPLDAPDEPSHFNYAMQVRSQHSLPVTVMDTPTTLRIPPSTPVDTASIDLFTRLGYADFEAMPYESTQPPLYYVVAALLTAPLPEDRLLLLYAIRLTTVIWGVGAVWALWFTIQMLWPRQPAVLWSAPLVLTLHPQFTFVTSVVNNDAALIFFGTLLLAVWASGLRDAARGGTRSVWHWGLLAGIVTGLGLLTKLNMVSTVPCTVLWLWWLTRFPSATLANRCGRLLAATLALGAVASLFIGWWFVRNLWTYGEITGSQGIFRLYHLMVLDRYGLPLDQVLNPFSLTGFLLGTFLSFWAVYGWMNLTLDAWIYLLLEVLSLLALIGALVHRMRGHSINSGDPTVAPWRLGWLSVAAFLTAFANLLFFNLYVGIQPQGRYLFVALAPALLLMLLGLTKVGGRPRVGHILISAWIALLVVMQGMSIVLLRGK